MKAVKAANDDTSEYRSWTAIGRRGEAYLAFFILSPQRMKISENLADLAKAVPVLYSITCTYREIWTQTDDEGDRHILLCIKVGADTMPIPLVVPNFVAVRWR